MTVVVESHFDNIHFSIVCLYIVLEERVASDLQRIEYQYIKDHGDDDDQDHASGDDTDLGRGEAGYCDLCAGCITL